VELTRRDALVALAASGVAIGGGAVALTWDDRSDSGDPAIGDHEVATLEAVATVLYPSSVEAIPTFLETYVAGKLDDRPERAEDVATAISTLDEYSRTWWDDAYVDLSPETRRQVPDHMGLDQVEARPDGNDVERVRYYLVDELLYALYTSPAGGKLLGIENPPGYPGGQASYQRGPTRE